MRYDISKPEVLKPLRLAAVVLAALPLLAMAQSRWESEVVTVERGEWTGPRLADGQPDIAGPLVEHDRQPRQLHRPARRYSRRRRSRGRRRRGRDRYRGASRAPSTEPRQRSAGRPGAVPAVGACRATGLARELLQPDERGVHRAARTLRAGGTDQILDVARLRGPPVSGLRAVLVRFGNAHRASDGPAASSRAHQAVERRLARPLGGQYARRRRAQQQR